MPIIVNAIILLIFSAASQTLLVLNLIAYTKTTTLKINANAVKLHHIVKNISID